ncbi:MAG TPA: alpha/beta fold hydrolase [Chthonomonadaceae bacterium]|nr:alpha/beta fold hydrolase [Chthonomonadaceae bacterium]
MNTIGTEQPERWRVPVGEDQTSALVQRAQRPLAESVLVLGHGASTHMEHPTMERLAREFLSRGLSVVRFNFLYTDKKKGPPDRMPRLMECFAAVVEKVRQELTPPHLFLGGHSLGGRTASMLAAEGFGCEGLLLLAYPLHPAGQPEKLRDAHLAEIKVPVLCLNGTRDELCEQALMQQVVERLPATFTMHWLEGADHGFHVQKRSGRTEDEVFEEIGEASREWVARVLGSRGA